MSSEMINKLFKIAAKQQKTLNKLAQMSGPPNVRTEAEKDRDIKSDLDESVKAPSEENRQ